MGRRLKLIDCAFDLLPEFDAPAGVLKSHAAGFGYAGFLQQRMDVVAIERIAYSGEVVSGRARFRFFNANHPLSLLRLFCFIRRERPDVVMVQGLIFPVQVILLRLFLKKRARIIAQHHGELPATGLKKRLQQAADRHLDAYLFTARGNVDPWIAGGIIPGHGKCHELLEASTCFESRDKETSRKRCGMEGGVNLLWVGRLSSGKDPFTVLAAFRDYRASCPGARLYMIYRETALLAEIKAFLRAEPPLAEAVCLVGEVPHEELPYWYSGADFYVSASRAEGSGFALLEAMACGCIPLVTDIPPFRKITGDGSYGLLYPPGDAAQLAALFRSLQSVDRKELSVSVAAYFSARLSFKSIAEGIAEICARLCLGAE
jgi:glycosyltransferase involved in cell wall biosynthesis